MPEETWRVELTAERQTVTMGTPKGLGVRDRTGALVMLNWDVVQSQTVEESPESREAATQETTQVVPGGGHHYSRAGKFRI